MVERGPGVPGWLGKLSLAERRVWRAFPSGGLVDLRVGGGDRRVRAEVLAALLRGVQPAAPGRTPAVRIAGAEVLGALDLDHAEVAVPLTAHQCWFDTVVRLDHATTLSLDLRGSVLVGLSAYGAHIRGTLDLRRAGIAGTATLALHADGASVDDDILAGQLDVHGPVCLIGARIGGMLALGNARIDCPGGVSLNAGSVDIQLDLRAQGFEAVGEVRLPGARVGRLMLFNNAYLRNPGARALSADSISVGGDVLFERAHLLDGTAGRGFVADGEIFLGNGRFDGVFSLRGARLNKPDGVALGLGGATIRRSLLLSDGFSASGEVRLIGARIDRHMNIAGADFRDAFLNLYAAETVGVHDQSDDWPDRVNFNHFTYSELGNYRPARERLAVIARQIDGYRAQPFEQLAAYYRSLGQDEQARTVLLAKERSRRRQLHWWQRVPGYFMDAVVGYGYRPARAVGWVAVLLVFGSVFFAHNRPVQVDPSQHLAYNPALYATELLVPLLNLGNQDGWQSRGAAQFVAVALIILGWALSITVAGAVTRTLTRT